MTNSQHSITTAISWCLAWGDKRQPKFDIAVLKQMRQALNDGKDVPEEVRSLVEQVKELQGIDKDYFPATLDELKSKYSELWNQTTRIGLVYGGATKIKQYMFESSKIQDIRGASALLDRINLIDLSAFFHKNPQSSKSYTIECTQVREWLDENFSTDYKLSEVLIPELIIYSTGGNILAFCPAAFVDDLANAIEKRYTEETLTANSCAVGDTFRLLELSFGLLREPIENTLWLDWYRQEYKKPLVQAYFGYPNNDAEIFEVFKNRKSFNELTTKLAILFNQRRSGYDFSGRPSRRYPPMFETHPYLMRDGGEHRSAVMIVQPPDLPRESHFSEASARKHLVGYRAKKGKAELPTWYKNSHLTWKSIRVEGWIDKFNSFLNKNPSLKEKYYGNLTLDNIEIPQSLSHIANASKGFVAYIYADGNNMGGYIQKILTAQKYQEFSQDVELATQYAVYQALAEKLNPHELRNLNDEESTLENGELVHPFEIITIGGDDIILIVPANKALEIAQFIGERFDKILLKEVPLVENPTAEEKIKGCYKIKTPEQPIDLKKCHRYKPTEATPSQCQLSTSIGVLITAYNTPIYYAKDLTEQLLKSAKERAKKLKEAGYYGGTVDFLTLKSVTMISSNIKEFREQALTKNLRSKLKLYAAPYTLHELRGFLTAISALKKANFPKSQLYQIRTLLERGKHTAILNYRYFRVRLKEGKKELQEQFEEAWCQPKDENNGGNLAPWMYDDGALEYDKSDYPLFETIWREMVELYEFIEEIPDSELSELLSVGTEL
ncbi:type III-B CRISPR-associated protein Cas10/Cmr2 [Brasilonema octagenarum UFV-E1]|uniref:Type III-B CRISPR-associated protein Cas10/Cmr2 n=2 Tax=Brasilonema TaxID=383614 RepID=A0A856MLL6_9CYAN|nr:MULTISPECIES: type III-B CRISPR-associated protein Cas10/Cmr2 [Brasilonema]NMF66460.1 type III-B CRISPR-associated protein Cas10/Cmr2 [Brasilonema octagenarum UFV-OR1]QDL09816.1 type III-B CRISPR-associated protein Cas10/Cmr2 [Brasilonema sennae CENA114]QDL16170.1 type III-B CRISPR-associated protein Cas10/Cmr2 [Brasilonema octagenarum UFV-E1]